MAVSTSGSTMEVSVLIYNEFNGEVDNMHFKNDAAKDMCLPGT